jgi:hypothetical protein
MKLPRLDWPQTALVLGLGAIAVLALIYAPADYHAPIGAALTLAVGVLRSIIAAPPPPPPPAAPPSGGPSAPDDDSDDTQPPTSDGPPTRPRRVTMPSTAARVERGYRDAAAPQTPRFLVVPGAVVRVGSSVTDGHVALGCSLAISIALVLGAALLTGCGASALRTHSTIATIARVSVVTAGDAVALTCETALARCTDAACVERTGGDCRTAATAAEAAIAGVRAYVDVIEVAARADEGQIGEALDLALQAMARVYESVRETFASLSLGVTLPPLPPVAVAIVRALVGGVAS